jgi:hypothetical protein
MTWRHGRQHQEAADGHHTGESKEGHDVAAGGVGSSARLNEALRTGLFDPVDTAAQDCSGLRPPPPSLSAASVAPQGAIAR